MDNRFVRRTSPALFGLLLLLPGCSSVNLWPFGGEGAQERSRAPANATEFRCDAGKRFHLRYLDGGASAWVIFPEREFRLDKVAAPAGTRYTNGSAMLEINGNEASLADGPTISYTGCKSAGG
ncbi:MAG: hypothetical protein EPO29_05535 [Betaproteobacteria bacterium]|nr:MAG: hypothetical protein EPO29_05535 [Betaproteobacteria bacterium]